jgi:hypothetical protein
MHKGTSLLILGVTAVLCSRVVLFLHHDSEGPNLLIVLGIASILFLLSFAVFQMASLKPGRTRLLLAIASQCCIAIVLYFMM